MDKEGTVRKSNRINKAVPPKRYDYPMESSLDAQKDIGEENNTVADKSREIMENVGSVSHICE